MRTPLIAHLVDVMATCVELAGTKYPAKYGGNAIKPSSGLSLLPLLRDEEREPHRAIYCEHWHSASVRSGTWKLVTPDYRDPGAWQLFDLEADPSETRDLRAREPERAQRLFGMCKAWADESTLFARPGTAAVQAEYRAEGL